MYLYLNEGAKFRTDILNSFLKFKADLFVCLYWITPKSWAAIAT